jgi:serine/threonine-protein kinase
MFLSNAARSIAFATLIVLSGLGFTATATTTSASATPDSTAASADQQTLMGMLSHGYSSANCTPVETSGGRKAAVKCGQNSDPGGPTSAFFTLYEDPDVMAADFSDDISYDDLFACPGLSEPSPTTWHYHSSGEVAGSLSCGTFGGAFAEVEWTSDANLLLGSVSGPHIAALYQWWTTKG